MKVFSILILVISVASSGWSQSFELVKVFPAGSKPEELGVLNPNTSDDDPTSCEEVSWAQGSWWILDNVNGRVIRYDKDWHIIKIYHYGEPYHFNLVLLRGGILLVNGYGFMRPIGGVYWMSFHDEKLHSIDLKLQQFVHSLQSYAFLFQYKDVLIFQNESQSYPPESASYFGIRGLATDKNEKQSYLDDAQVRGLLADPANKRYRLEGDVAFDTSQALFGDTQSVKRYFASIASETWIDALGVVRGKFALANGNYLLSEWGFVLICNKNGNTLVQWITKEKYQNAISYTNFFPAPDGYLYQLRGDYAHKETRLYRLGPFPELELGYHGRGGTVNNDQVNLREGPSTSSKVITQLDKGTPVRILDQTKKSETIAGETAIWYKVRLWDRTEGWIFGAFLKPVEQ